MCRNAVSCPGPSSCAPGSTPTSSRTILIYHESERWFNPFWSGIPHRQWFDWLETEDVLERPLQEWIETHKITWLALPITEWDRLQGSDEGRAFLAQLLPLRDFTGPPRRSGIEVALYRLWRMQHESDIRFGEHIRLVGYDLHDPDPLPGDPMAFTFYWNAPTRPPENYSLFLHLVAADGTSPFAQVDGNPAVPERLTQTWDRADETLISPRFTLGARRLSHPARPLQLRDRRAAAAAGCAGGCLGSHAAAHPELIIPVERPMRSSLARILEGRPGALPAQWRFWLIVGLIALMGRVLRVLRLRSALVSIEEGRHDRGPRPTRFAAS